MEVEDFMYAGIDWTGTPDVPPDMEDDGVSTVYGSAVVGFDTPTYDVDGFCAALKQQHGMSEGDEFHAYELTNHPDILISLLQFVVENGLIYALFWDKRQLLKEDGTIFNKPKVLAAAAGMAVLSLVLMEQPIKRLWCDEEIKGKANEQAFSAKLNRLHKGYYGKARKGPYVKYKDSTKSNLIQLADVCVYVLQRYIRGLKLSPELQRLAQQIWQSPGVRWGEESDLRPYLP